VGDTFPVGFGRYTLVERLAMGGMAELFLATAPGEHGFQKKVVIKRLLPHLLGEDHNVIRLPPPVELRELLLALKDVMKRAELYGHHEIERDALNVRSRMSDLLNALGDGEFHRFENLFDASEGRRGVVVTFLALLELAKEQLVEIVQEAALAPIYLKSLATQ
jgi:chromatin segregation and condensation protein Rec8/ScpA/Scc1 (kleisin family)